VWISVNEKTNIIQCLSPYEFRNGTHKVFETNKEVFVGQLWKGENSEGKARVAFISDYNVPCGISTFAGFLVEELGKLVEVKIFAEHHKNNLIDPKVEVSGNLCRCWTRNQKMDECVRQIKEYNPSIIIVNFEWGLIPNGRHLLKFIQDVSDVPTLFIMHSVFNHMDKNILTAAMPHLIVHSERAKQVLINGGYNGNINIIRHGRFPLKEMKKPWPILGKSKKIGYFGFLFEYKSIETIIEAIGILQAKYPDVLFICLGSQSGYFDNIHSAYYYKLKELVEEKGLEDNVIILSGFFSDLVLEGYLLLCDACVFSHKKTEGHEVYGASGSVSLPLSLGIPTVVNGESFQFDEFDGILPKPKNAKELAEELDKIFSNQKYGAELVGKAAKYINQNNWQVTAGLYLELINKILQK
jgi:glycosyltransferase involved in cell wall biosynthesis